MTRKYNKRILGILIICLTISVITMGCSPPSGYATKSPICKTVYETQTTNEQKMIDVPYEYSVSNFVNHNSGLINDYSSFSLKITNQEDRGGEFQVKFTIKFKDGGQEVWYSPAQYIGIKQSHTFRTITYKNRNPYAAYEVIPPTKTEMITVPVTKKVAKTVCV